MNFDDKLNKILDRHQILQDKMSEAHNLSSEQYIELSKEYSSLEDVVIIIKKYKKIVQDLKDTESILQDESIEQEMKLMAEEELSQAKRSLPEIERQLKIALLPKDEADSKNAILEVRAGTGGEEAALFAAKLFSMYQKYATDKGWRFEILSLSETGIGGYKEASALISGGNVFAKLKFESGVHRVQRVPETESSGRVHTSAATVAILPEAEEVDIEIAEKDLRIDVYRASGAGGQHVNTTDSAVRITHIPTNIVVQCQDEKSQHKNKAKAMKVLRSRIYDHERMQKEAERSQDRKSQVGSGDRSERIRTYNFPQGRVTDHRINLTLYKIEEIVEEGNLDELIEALISEDEARKLAAVSDGKM